MATTRIPQLPLAIGLDGTEELEIAQSDGSGGYVSRRTTSQDVADLALAPTGVGAGTYGSENQVAQFTVSASGLITAAANVTIDNVPIANTTGTLAANRGGTGISAYTIGDLLYASGAAALSAIPIGAPGEVLAVNPVGNGYQFIVAAGVGTVTSVGLAAPADFDVTGTPVIAAGTLTLDWAVAPTGTGAMVRETSPTLVTPILGVAAATSVTVSAGFYTSPMAAPSNPGVANQWVMYSDTADGELKAKKSDGTVVVLSSSGGGTVETVAVASANGFAGTSDGDPADPTLTLSTTVTGILQGNGTAISAASTTGTGAVVLETSPTIVTPTIAKLANLTTNGLVTTSAGDGTLGVTVPASGILTWLATPSSANLAAAMTDETGTGLLVFATSPALTTPTVATSISPASNDGASLGISGTAFSDLFLASGGVINWDAGNYTLTHSAGLLTANGSFSVGTANVITTGTIEVGAASDTTISRAAAGVIAVEGVPLYSNIPQNSQSTAYTTVLADAQKHLLHPSADNNPRTFTIDSNANVPYPIGTAITFVNQINTLTIAITSDTLILAGLGSTGSRTLAASGMATALKIGTTTWMISGAGLT